MGTERPIQNGTPADGAFPAVAALRYAGTYNGAPMDKIGCSATLIAPDALLTAGHCVDRDITDQVGLPRVSFADDTSAAGTEWLSVRGVRPHDDYVHGTLFHIYLETPNDIALVFLDRPVENITPVPLAVDAIATGTSIDMVGFGQRTLYDDATLGLKYVTTMTVSEVGTTEMREVGTGCAGFGDSGGPTFADGRIVGVTSHGGGETLTCDHGAISERVDHYADWIDEHLRADGGGCSAAAAPPSPLVLLVLIAIAGRSRSPTRLGPVVGSQR